MNQCPVLPVFQLRISGGQLGLAFLLIADTEGAEHLALTHIQGINTTIGLGVTGHFIGNLGPNILIGDSAVAHDVGGVLGSGNHIHISGKGAGAEIGGDACKGNGGGIVTARGNDLQSAGGVGIGISITGDGGKVIIHNHGAAIPSGKGQILLNTVPVRLLHKLQQLHVLKVGGNIRVHEGKGELLLVGSASLVHSGIQSGGIHLAINGGAMLLHKFLVLGVRGGHSKNTLQHGQNGFLIQGVLVLGNLGGNITHEVNPTGNVIAEILFSPCLGPTDHHHTLFKGLGGSGGNIGFTVIVHRIPIQQATHGKTGVSGAVLTGEHRPNIGVPGQRTGFLQSVQGQVGNTANHILEGFRVERLCIKLAVSHRSNFLSLCRSRGGLFQSGVRVVLQILAKFVIGHFGKIIPGGLIVGITLFSGLGPLEFGLAGVVEKKSGVLTLYQLPNFIIKPFHCAIIGQFRFGQEIGQQRLHSNMVLGLGGGKGQINGIADLQGFDFIGVVFVFLLVGFLKGGDLVLKFRVITRGFLQGVNLPIPFRNLGFQGFVFLIHFIEAGLGHKRTVQPFHNLVGLFLGQAPFHQLFFRHSVIPP